MSTRKYVEVPDEFTGKPLEAKVTSITHAYKYIDIFLEISLPGDAGSVPYKKRLWSRIPNNSKTDFSKQNDASLHLWRTILGIPESVTNTQLVEKIDTLAMLDLLEYRLEVSMETSEEGRKFLKVISYDAVPIDWYNMCRKYREALMEIESLEQKAAESDLQAPIDQAPESAMQAPIDQAPESAMQVGLAAPATDKPLHVVVLPVL